MENEKNENLEKIAMVGMFDKDRTLIPSDMIYNAAQASGIPEKNIIMYRCNENENDLISSLVGLSPEISGIYAVLSLSTDNINILQRIIDYSADANKLLEVCGVMPINEEYGGKGNTPILEKLKEHSIIKSVENGYTIENSTADKKFKIMDPFNSQDNHERSVKDVIATTVNQLKSNISQFAKETAGLISNNQASNNDANKSKEQQIEVMAMDGGVQQIFERKDADTANELGAIGNNNTVNISTMIPKIETTFNMADSIGANTKQDHEVVICIDEYDSNEAERLLAENSVIDVKLFEIYGHTTK